MSTESSALGAVFRQAQNDPDLRVRIYYCPDSVVDSFKLSSAERIALCTGDLSRVRLDDDDFELGRRLFNELPIEQVPPAADTFADPRGNARRQEVCP